MKSVRDRKDRITLQNPGPPAPDGDGGFVFTWIDLDPPALYAQVTPATQAALERVAAGTVLSTASHLVTCPFHPQVTTKTRLLLNGRRLNVTFVGDDEERHVELTLVCAEVVA